MATAAPRKRTTPAAKKAAPAKATAPAVEPEIEEVEDIEVEKHVFALTNMGLTKKGEGKDEYHNLHGRVNGAGIRGQIFAPPGAVRVALLIEYPKAEATE